MCLTLSGRADHVSTVAECASCAVSAAYPSWIEWSRRGGLKLPRATGSRWAPAVRVHGRAEPAPQGRLPGPGRPAPYRAVCEEPVAQNPGLPLLKARDALMAAEEVQVQHASIAALLSRLGLTKVQSAWPPGAAAPGQADAACKPCLPCDGSRSGLCSSTDASHSGRHWLKPEREG